MKKIFGFLILFLFFVPLSFGLTGDGASFPEKNPPWAEVAVLMQNSVEKEEPEEFLPENVSLETVPRTLAHRIDSVKGICQYPTFGSGCESVSAVMLLRYLGMDISVADFVDDYLEKDDRFSYKRGKTYGPDPYEVFAGDPRTSSFGCMAPVIKKAMEKVSDSLSVTDLTGFSLHEICQRYIANDRPVLVWVTRDMLTVSYQINWYLPSGERFWWPSGEHCMLLVGFDETYYYLMDPERGACRKFKKAVVEKRYEDLGKQALAAKTEP